MHKTAIQDLRAHRTADSQGSRLAVAALRGVGERTISSVCIVEADDLRARLVFSVVLGLGFGLTLALIMRLSLVWVI